MDKLKSKLESILEFNETKKAVLKAAEKHFFWKDSNLPNPFNVVEQYIMEKGLKLYGGQAIHEYIKKKDGKGFYVKHEFPDYDVFSPDAWNQAKELCDILFDMGYDYVEAKPSILNDKHHQTYKVSVDFIPMLDLTQVGCPIETLKTNNCRTCSVKINGKCESIFNKIPVINIKNKNESDKIYRETFDYNTLSSIYPTKLFISSPEWLKVSMYWELSQPQGNIARLPKVGTRLALLENYYQTKFRNVCEPYDKDFVIDKQLQKILDFLKGEIKKSDIMVEYGPYTHNYYMTDPSKHIPVINYQVYSSNMPYIIGIMMEKLKKKFKNIEFKSSERHFYWKQHIDEETRIYAKINDKFHLIFNVAEAEICFPYVKSNHFKHASYDLMVFNYRHRKELPELYKEIEGIPFDYECLLKDLSSSYKKNHKNKTKKFKRYVTQCMGGEINKIEDLMMDRWIDKRALLKKTKYYVDYPQKGYISKITPIVSNKKNFLPYKPSEHKFKKYYHFTKKGKRQTLGDPKKLDSIYAA